MFYQKDTEIVGYISDDGPICPTCFAKQRRSDLSPLFAGETEEWLNPRDRSLHCATCKEEIVEPDSSYAEQYELLAKRVLCFRDQAGHSYCLDCAWAVPEQSQTVPFTAQNLDLLRETHVVCALCEKSILQGDRTFIQRFEHNWGNPGDVLNPWIQHGFLRPDGPGTEQQ